MRQPTLSHYREQLTELKSRSLSRFLGRFCPRVSTKYFIQTM